MKKCISGAALAAVQEDASWHVGVNMLTHGRHCAPHGSVAHMLSLPRLSDQLFARSSVPSLSPAAMDMNNPQMAAMAQAMMSDPEVMQMMMQPGVRCSTHEPCKSEISKARAHGP